MARRYDQSTEAGLKYLRTKLSESNPVEISAVTVVAVPIPAASFDGHALFAGAIWHVTGRLVRRDADARIVLAGLGLVALDPPDMAITTRVSDAVPRDLLGDSALAWLREHRRLDEWVVALELPNIEPGGPQRRQARQKAAEAVGGSPVPPRGPRGTPPDFYERLAIEVVDIASGREAIVAELARRHERSETAVKNWLRTMRRAGVLDAGHAVWKLGPEHPARKEKGK